VGTVAARSPWGIGTPPLVLTSELNYFSALEQAPGTFLLTPCHLRNGQTTGNFHDLPCLRNIVPASAL
jgi:hypothetical protein